MTGVNAPLERLVRAEMGRRRRRSVARPEHPNWPRALARSIHHGELNLLEHLRRVAEAVPDPCKPVAWLHYANDGRAVAKDLAAAGMSRPQSEALSLLALRGAVDERTTDSQRTRATVGVSGASGRIARGVAEAALIDLAAGRPRHEDRIELDRCPFVGAR